MILFMFYGLYISLLIKITIHYDLYNTLSIIKNLQNYIIQKD